MDNENIRLFPLGTGAGKTVIVFAMKQELPTLEAMASRLAGEYNGLLVLFEVQDWFCDLSPWPAPAAFGENAFAGCGAQTLQFITGELLPALPKQKTYCAGYSLGGLFSLWALLESGAFAGCASCSGSLWYPGWENYIKGKYLPADSAVYLSLGTHEERTRNSIMCTVGDRTRAMAALCESEGTPYALEWNPGGHFKDPMGRLEKGIRWILSL